MCLMDAQLSRPKVNEIEPEWSILEVPERLRSIRAISTSGQEFCSVGAEGLQKPNRDLAVGSAESATRISNNADL